MDFNASFSISNGNGNATNNGINVNNSTLLSSNGSDLTAHYTSTARLLPGFDTLFNNSSPVPSYANDPLRGADLDSFLAEQGQEFGQTENTQPQSAKSSAANKVLKNGSANSIPSQSTLFAADVNIEGEKSVDSEPVTRETEKMSEFAAEDNFMGFQPLDSNGNTSDGSPSVLPLKRNSSLAVDKVERGSADTSIESDSDASDSENDYKSAEDGVDSANPDAEMVADEQEDNAAEVDDDPDAEMVADEQEDNAAEVDDDPDAEMVADEQEDNAAEVDDGDDEGGEMETDEVVGGAEPGDGSRIVKDAAPDMAEAEPASDESEAENNAAQAESNDVADKKEANLENDGGDVSDAKDAGDKNVAQKEGNKLDEKVTDSDTDNETESADESNLDHSYSSQKKKDNAVDKMDVDTETEDEGKLVIDDGTGDGQSSDVDIEGTNDAKSPRDALILFKKQKMTSVDIGFTSQTPELPDFTDSKSMCWCGGEETPEMIACDSPRCKIVWYHYNCVNVKPDQIPEGDWYCPTCKGSGLDNKERPLDTARHHIKLSQDDEEPNKRRRKQTLKAREAAAEDDIDFEITVNDDSSDHEHSFIKDEMVDDPLTGGKVYKKERKPSKVKVVRDFDSGSEGEFELPSWHGNPKELFEGMQRPHGPRAMKLRKPFEHGWAREIVVRFKYENLKGTGRPPMDVYYFTPEGKKLRSLVQIGDYLSETKEDYGLTTDNFSLNRIPVHKEPWENIRMANIGRSAGSAKGAQAKRGRPSMGRGKGKPIMGSMMRPIGRPPKNSPGGSPRPLYMPLAEEKEEPKSFPEMLNLKPVLKPSTDTPTGPPTGPPVPSQKARKSFRPMELPKRLLNPLEQSMPDPKRPKLNLKVVQGVRHENHIQLHNEGGFRLCSLECVGQVGKPPTLHCGVCMCLFHPQCVQFVGNTSAALFVCDRCRKQPIVSSKRDPVVITGSMYASGSKYTPSALSGLKTQLAQNTSVDFTNIPKTIEPLSDVMRPLTIEKASHDNETPEGIQTQVLGSPLVPPPPVLKPMTVAAHLKSMEHENKKQNVVSWSFSDGNLKFANTMSKPPPLKSVRAPLGQLPSLTTLPGVASKPATVQMIPTSLGPTSVSVVRSALANHLQQTTSAVAVSASPTIMSSANSNDIRMAGQLLTLPGNIINRIKMNEPLALKINNQSLVVNPDCFVQTSHGVKIFLPPNTLPVQTGNKTINITVPQTTSSAMPATTVSHSNSSTIQASSCTPIVVGASTGTCLPGIKKTAMPEMAKPAFTSPIPNVGLLKSTVGFSPEERTILQSRNISPDSQPMMTGQGLVPIKQEPLSPVLPPKRTRRKIQGVNPAACFIKQLHGGYDSLLQIFSYLSVPDLLKVSQVCRRWRSIVTESWMWRTVRLRGNYVTDWDTAMNFLHKVGTKKLDLRGLRHIDDRNRTWHQITGVLDKMTDLNVIHFGQCPASILHAVTEKVTDLKVLTAEWITEIFEEPQMWTTNTKLDMAKFAKMSHLEELRLRGVCGLVLPSFSFSGGLEDLSKLQKLKKLSLTTLKEVSGNDFNFIGQLTNLEELEIGDSTHWTEETYSHLSKLENLKILRLENGGDLEDPGLASALKCLKLLTKLELVMFIIPSTLKDALSELSNLEELSVWPDPRDQPALVNTNTLNALKNMSHLKKLEWGVVTSEDGEERAENEDHSNLPFLPSAFVEKKTSEKSDSDEKSEKTLEGEANKASGAAMETGTEHKDENEAEKENVPLTSEEVITTQKLHDRLSAMLIETKVTINDVAVLSSQKGRPRTKST